MLSIHQCRAARGLLGWTQADLANASGLSKTAINNFERGLSAMKNESLAMIRHALEIEGLHFTSHDGVERRHDAVSLFSDWTEIDDVIQNALFSLQKERFLYILNMEPHLADIPLLHLLEGLDKIEIKHIGRNESNQKPSIPQSSRYEYRWLSPLVMPFTPLWILTPSSYIVHIWDSHRFLVLQQQCFVNKEKNRFETIWQNANLP